MVWAYRSGLVWGYFYSFLERLGTSDEMEMETGSMLDAAPVRGSLGMSNDYEMPIEGI
jgi:hypothetical protein